MGATIMAGTSLHESATGPLGPFIAVFALVLLVAIIVAIVRSC